MRTIALICMLMGLLYEQVCGHDGVKAGIDNLIDTDFALLRSRRITLVTHAAARTLSGTSTADVLCSRTDCTVTRILAPEHGFYGIVAAGDAVNNDSLNGIPVMSLYGAMRRPDRSMLEATDVVVIDLQDIGVRSYTYISTMTEVMDACGEAGIPVMILDRPDPLGGVIVDGNIPDDSVRNFICRLPIPYVHGCTMGELATMINGERWIDHPCSLTVVKCKRWRRSMTWEDVGRPWYPTSPNIPSIEAVRGYATIGLVGELGLCSIGIGTATPFTVIGAPDMLADSVLVHRLRKYGVTLMLGAFMPTTGKYARTACRGYYVAPARHEQWRPYLAAITLLARLHQTRQQSWSDTLAVSRAGKMFVKATGTPQILQALQQDMPWPDLEALSVRGLTAFVRMRERYLLYP